MTNASSEGVRIVPRNADDLESLARLFEATHEISGYPGERPPTSDQPSWLTFVAREDPWEEFAGLVACQNIANADPATSGSSDTVSEGRKRKLVGHVSLRRVPVPVDADLVEFWANAKGISGYDVF